MKVDRGEQISDVANFDMQAIYPQSDEGLIDFLECCKLDDSKTMLFPCCGIVFYEEAANKLERTRRFAPRRGRAGSQAGRFSPNNGGRPRRSKKVKEAISKSSTKNFSTTRKRT